LSWEEFEELTPGTFQELAKRRNISIRYDRYANALPAAAIYNVNRGSEEDRLITAFDFVRTEDDSAKLERIREGKKYINKVIGELPMSTPRSKYLDVRRRAIADLTASKFENPESLFDSVWPHLKPTEEESNQCPK
jgi:hypothetical protein